MRYLTVFFLVLVTIGQLIPLACAQTNQAMELEGAIAKEQADGDLKTAIQSFQKLSGDASAPREIRAKALLHLAGCYEKQGRQSKQVYEQIVREYADQRLVAAQARARLTAYATLPQRPSREFKPKRLTANTPDLTIQAAGISPDGKRIAYSDQLGIHVRAIATGESRLLAGTEDYVFVRWASDGDHVQAQLQNELGETANKLFAVSPDRSMPLTLTDGSVPSPDGSRRASLSADRSRLTVEDVKGNVRLVWKAPSEEALDQFVWSPDNKTLSILTSRKGDNGYQSTSTVELLDCSKDAPPKVLVAESQKLKIGSMAWASPGRLIFVVNKETGPEQYDSNLWELNMNAKGDLAGKLRALTSWTDTPIRPASLNIQGNRLIFIRSFRQRDVYIGLLEEGGTRMGRPRRLTLDLSDDYPSDWTLDSKTVIITSNRVGQVQTIFRQDLDKETAERVFVMAGQQVMARVTPDGKSLIFMNRYPPANPVNHLMSVSLSGGTPVPIPHTPNPGWFYRCSIAGVCINAQRENDTAPYVVTELDPVTGQGREIYRDAQLEHPHVSPDGKWIADTSGAGKDTKIILRSFATGEVVRQISVQGAVKIITFGYSADGKGFYCGDASPTQVRELYVDLTGKSFVLYHEPASIWGIWGIPSPDGRYLALVLATDDSNVYMVEDF